MAPVLGRSFLPVLLLLLGLLLLLAEGCITPRSQLPLPETIPPTAQIPHLIRTTVAEDLEAHPQSREANLLQRFYLARQGEPAWIGPQGVRPAAWQLIEVLEMADREGLPPERYEPEDLKRMLQPASAAAEGSRDRAPAEVVRLELALSRAFFRYAGDCLWGQERSWRSRGDWHRQRRDIDPVRLLDLAFELGAFPSAIRGLPPVDPGYLGLKQALHDYRNLAAAGGWPQIPDGAVLHPGEPDARLEVLRRRLLLEGDLSLDAAKGANYDSQLEEGLKRFQQRHGLTPDGVLGGRTLASLNVGVGERIDQIVRNMERWRWGPGGAADNRIDINLADFSLAFFELGELQLQMPVVIGRRTSQTPLFSSQLESLILEPYWYVPPTLLRETLPRIATDRSFLKRNHYEVLDKEGNPIQAGGTFRRQWQRGEVEAALRQEPGPWNPMGQVKFQLPNPWSIYLHDTPQKQLFSRTERAFSAGCIRLSEPQNLARHLLARNLLEPEEIEGLFDSGRSRLIPLKEPVPIRIGYWTAWVDEGGRVNFRDDIYGRDRRLARELRQRLPRFAAAE